MNIKLTNGKKTIVRLKVDYEANVKHFEMRGFKLLEDKVKENIKEVDQTFENETKVVTLKPKKRKAKKK